MAVRRRSAFDSPVSDVPEVPVERVLVFALFFVLGVAALLARLWYLQILRGEDYLAEANLNQQRRVRIVPPRGIIEDRNGRPLVTNVSRIAVFVVPDEFNRGVMQQVRAERKKLKRRLNKAEIEKMTEAVRKRLFARLAELVEGDPGEMEKNFNRNYVSPSDPAMVITGITQTQLARVAERLDELPGVTPQIVPQRHYPNGRLAGQLLGYIDQISAEELANEKEAARREKRALRYRPGDQIGRYGLERYYDSLLAGTEGAITYEVNAAGSRQRQVGVEEATPGARLTLTLDSKLQAQAEKIMAGRKGALVALDPQNGEVLAMCSDPGFDPSWYQRRPIPQEVFEKELNPGQQSKAINANYPPGSTFKIISAAAGLTEGVVTPATGFSCAHEFQGLKCHGTHGGVSLRGALAQSCDVYFYQVGRRLGEEKLKTWAQAFGIGKPTGIDLPKDPIGFLSTSKRKEGSFNSQADDAREAGDLAKEKRFRAIASEGLTIGEVMQTSIGQGLTGASPLHMAMVVSAAATGGKIYRPHLLKEATASDGSGRTILKVRPEVAYQPKVSKAHWSVIREGLRLVVTSGTARKTANSSVATVYGKTGTAETGRRGHTHAWFVGYASKGGKAPSIAVCAFLESNGRNLHGGDHAAPLARQLIEAYFGAAPAAKQPAARDGGPARGRR